MAISHVLGIKAAAAAAVNHCYALCLFVAKMNSNKCSNLNISFYCTWSNILYVNVTFEKTESFVEMCGKRGKGAGKLLIIVVVSSNLTKPISFFAPLGFSL
jgi:hypothetical protein